MILEIEDETRDFLSVYKKDYYSKKAERLEKFKPVPSFQPPLNPLNGPYKEYLNTRKQNGLLHSDERTEDPQEYLNRIRSKCPHLYKILPATVPDEDLIEEQRKKLSKTAYQVDYSKDLDDHLPLHKQRIGVKKVQLPEDWIIQETIQRRSYRNPRQITTREFLRVKAIPKPPDNLSPDPKQREILRTATGDSEYGGVIGHTGDRILQERFLGTPPTLEPPKFNSDDSNSRCSQILSSTPTALPSNVF